MAGDAIGAAAAASGPGSPEGVRRGRAGPPRDPATETRESLLLRVRDPADSASWREFVEIYRPLIVGYARSRGLSEAAAIDVAQDVFVRLLRHLPLFELKRHRGRFRTWLYRVTANAVIDGMRSDGRRNRAEGVYADRKDKREWMGIVQRRILEYALEKVKAAVKPTPWACFERHLLGRRPAAEVAAELGVNANVVYVYTSKVLARVRVQCRELMGDLDDGPDGLPG